MSRYETLTIAALVALAGCQTSFSELDGSVDAAGDTALDSAGDTTGDVVEDTAVDTAPPPEPYVLHEWGVMVMGDEGASMHGPAPAFAGPVPAKPVIYLYAEEDVELDVAVTFTSGGPTETWPETALSPTVRWDGLHVSPGACDTTPFPTGWDDPGVEDMCEACSLGQVVVEEGSCIEHGDQTARLLFYTGALPDYRPPLEVSYELHTDPGVEPWVTFIVENGSDRVVEDLWLIYRDTTDWCIDPSACPVATADIAWAYLDSVEPLSGESLSQPIQHFEAELDEHGYPIPGTLGLPEQWLALGGALEGDLTERGLSAAEAGAFMNAWETIFFGLMGSDAGYIEPFYRNGASAIYFMDRESYDAHLPLSAVPAPTDTVRVGMVYEPL
jgi:hypothetical protein